MSGSTRSRQKRKLEPISLEELAGTTGMSGFCTFLTRDNSVAVPALDALDSSAPDSVPSNSTALIPPAPEISAPESIPIEEPETSAPKSSQVESSAPVLIAPLIEIADLSAPDITAPDFDAIESGALEPFVR